MEFGMISSGVRTVLTGLATFFRIKSSLSTPVVSFFFAVAEGYGYKTPLSRKHFVEELKRVDRNGRWLEIHINIANGTGQDVTIQGLAIHANKSPIPIADPTFGGEVLPHRLLTNQSESWSVSIKELSQRVNTFPTDFDAWPDLNLHVKLGNGKTVRAQQGISKKVWTEVTTAWNATLA